MLQWLKSRFLPSADTADDAPISATAPKLINAPGIAALQLDDVLRDAQGLPVFDWQAIQAWVERIPDSEAQSIAWGECERAWFAHMCAALGPRYQVREQGSALLLSSLDTSAAKATLAYVNKSLQRIVRVLDGLAVSPEWGYDLLIVFDDAETYYQYVSHYYSEDGEFAASSGMYIAVGCGHFVTIAADLHAVEPVIAHELTHACLGHLPLPVWLNEGLAVNTERRLSPPPPGSINVQQMHQRHLQYWDARRLQAFWSGQSFYSMGDASELSYDLAQLLVAHLATDWELFRDFANHAQSSDAGAEAANIYLGANLGELVCALVERDYDPHWELQPAS